MVRPVNAQPELARMLAALRLIVVTLAAGVALFLAYVAWDHYAGGGAGEMPGRSLLTWVAVGLALVNVATCGTIRAVMLRAAREAYAREDVRAFVGKYQAATIVWCAGLEGAGLMAGVAFLLEGRVLSLALAAFLACWILFSIPTRGRLDSLLE